jgi:hypothetical protein
MTIEWWRDLSLIIFSFTATGVLLFVGILALLLFSKVTRILDPVRRTADIVEEVAQAIKKQAAAILPYIVLVGKGVEACRGFFRKDKEEKKE